MPELLIQIIFGWPGAVTSLALSVAGLITKRYWLLLVGAVLLIPSTYYLGGGPGIYRLIMLVPLFQLGSAFAIYKNKILLAWSLLVPALLAVAYLLFLFIYVQLMEA